MVDASRPLDENDHEIIEMIRDKKAVILLNKSDLSTVVDKKALETLITKPMIDISAKEETGIHELESTLKEMFYHGDISFNDEVYITNIQAQNSSCRCTFQPEKGRREHRKPDAGRLFHN